MCLELIDFELIELYARLSKMTNVTQEEKLEWREHFDEVIFGTAQAFYYSLLGIFIVVILTKY